MERAGSFTAVPGKAMVLIGLTALATAPVAAAAATARGWLTAWVVDGTVASAIAAVAIAAKAKRLALPLRSGPTRRFALAFLPSLAAGAILTVLLVTQGLGAFLPGAWLLLYGTAVTAGGALSVRIVPLMGLCFMAAGVAALVVAPAYGTAMMAAGFGALHVAFGWAIARRYGG
jgi:hypothetical protein